MSPRSSKRSGTGGRDDVPRYERAARWPHRLRPQSGPAQSVMHAVAEKVVAAPGTAWHCCLEVYSVATRLPPEFRLSPADALRLIEEEIFARLAVHDLPAGDRRSFLRTAAADGTAGGRVYDAHIAEIARGRDPRRRHRQPASFHGGIAPRTTRRDAARIPRRSQEQDLKGSGLSDFRVARHAALDDLLTQSIAVVLHRGIVTMARFAQDGTRVAAARARARFDGRRRWRRALRQARKQVARKGSRLREERRARRFTESGGTADGNGTGCWRHRQCCSRRSTLRPCGSGARRESRSCA